MTPRVFRLGLSLLAASAGSAWIVSCVGDSPAGSDPSTPDSSLASSSGGSSSGSSGGSSGNASSGGGSSGAPELDGGPDAAAPCAGEVGCPADISGSHLQLWLRGDRGVTCDDALTRAWNDQSGHARNALPVVLADGGQALPPVCNAALINGKPVLSFDSVYNASGGELEDKTLKVDLGFLQNTSFTVAVVHRRTQTRQGSLLAFGGKVVGVNGCFGNDPHTGIFNLAVNFNSGGVGDRIEYEVEYSCNQDYYPGDLASTSAELLEYVYSPNTGRHVYRNRVELMVVNPNDAGLVGVTADGGSEGRIGRSPTNPIVPLDARYGGEIAEIVAYDEALAAADRVALEAYLKNKWALP